MDFEMEPLKVKELKDFLNNLPPEYDDVKILTLTEIRTLKPLYEISYGEAQGRHEVGKVTEGSFLLIR